jgi:hypothetical protein
VCKEWIGLRESSKLLEKDDIIKYLNDELKPSDKKGKY